MVEVLVGGLGGGGTGVEGGLGGGGGIKTVGLLEGIATGIGAIAAGYLVSIASKSRSQSERRPHHRKAS